MISRRQEALCEVVGEVPGSPSRDSRLGYRLPLPGRHMSARSYDLPAKHVGGFLAIGVVARPSPARRAPIT